MKMKLVSTLSLGIALALGLGTVAATAPVHAAKKEKAAPAAAGPSYKLGKEFRAAAAPLQKAIEAKDVAAARAALPAASAAASTPDEKYVAGQFHVNVGGMANDTKLQAEGVRAMLASGFSSPDVPKLNFFAGSFAYNSGDYAAAQRYLVEADRLGYKGTDGLLLLAESYFKTNQVQVGLPYVDKAIASEASAGRKAPESWYQRAASVSYKAKLTGEVAKWTRAQVRAYPTSENWRSALVTYRDSQRLDGQPMLDLFRLMRATKSLKGERDYFEYASAATERGLPGEAKAVIDEGFVLGTVPKGSRAIGEMLTMASSKVPSDRASLATSEKQAGSSANGRLAANTADAYLGYGDDAKAISLYRTALQKGQVDTDAVNTRLGIALARSGQKDEARKLFTSVTGARAEIAKFWLLWLDTTA
jgi:hypothetical protein